jgi:hypothetical protein
MSVLEHLLRTGMSVLEHLLRMGISIHKYLPRIEMSGSKQRCHPDRSVAQWRDLLFIIRGIKPEWKRHPPLCHPDRSVTKWRDLQFRGPLLEMFSN